MSDFYSKYLEMMSSEKKRYRGAGFIFYQKNGLDFDFLLGLDNKNNTNMLSVFGGGREPKETNSLYTACRETFEELFNVLPNGIDIFVNQMQKKVDDYSVLEKMFMKKDNEVCYFADISILQMFIDHLTYHECPWTFKGKHQWSDYKYDIVKFIQDRVLKPNQKANNGLHEIKKVFLVNIKDITQSLQNADPKANPMKEKKGIIIEKKEYYLRDNLNRYLQEKIIIDIIHKIL
jgi:hypothetical protein